ncbi:hypothetical protein G7Z17_g12799 [Cylindrodendrum hubeiense]|uniref:Uncharacterized protein n=1 Tax=Cylindrodendrum hubeiense TaxID=595255 RepID=A0A9P5GUT9_9HYPO|nr:hypothetical protein G7Z17_g12799 [Cylindrodendrum hubeiense]
MDGTGYKDAAKLKAALELAQSFKKGPAKEQQHHSKGGSSTKASKPQTARQYQEAPNSIGMARDHERQKLPPLNVPLPSKRSYTTTLVSDLSQIGSGPIMGTKALDFLCRQDNRVKPEGSSVFEVTRKNATTVAATPATGVVSAELTRAQGSFQQHRPNDTKSSVVGVAQKDVAPVSAKPATITVPPNLTGTQGSQPLIDLEPEPNTPEGDIVDIFFSLMDQEPDDMANELSVAPPSSPLRVANDHVSVAVTTQPVLQPTKLNQGSSPLESDQGTTRFSPLRIDSEKRNGTELQKENFRPKAPEFIPERASSKNSNQGITTGQLYLQTPVNVTQGTIFPTMTNSATQDTVSFDASLGPTASTPLRSDSSTAAPRKPTKGLKASMWATK